MSCLFNSLSYFLGISSYEIRQHVCNYLEEDRPIIDGLQTSFIMNLEGPNYIQNMRNPSTWGGAIEIQAACNLWNLKILVKNNRDGRGEIIEFLPIHQNIDRTIGLDWTGGHYEPVRHQSS